MGEENLMFRFQHRRLFGAMVGGVAVAAALLGSVAVTASASTASSRPTITSVSFGGTSGPGVGSPTITLHGSGFGTNPPAGTPNNSTSCGAYTANGQVYGNQLYFLD